MGFLGLVASITPAGIALEENMGLHLLFRLRGARRAPPDVVVVATESASENQLNLPTSLTKWPRSLHARLIDKLADNDAAVIAFDVFFRDQRSTQDDHRLAKSIQRAGNIVLVEELEKKILFDESGKEIDHLEVETIVPPFPLLAQSALTSAPFPLPKKPVRLNSYWAFKTSAGDTPTLPVVVFQVFALQVYDEFIGFLKELTSSSPELLPTGADVIYTDNDIKEIMLRLKFEDDEKMKLFGGAKRMDTPTLGAGEEKEFKWIIISPAGKKVEFTLWAQNGGGTSKKAVVLR